jgi:hypothetical protein
MPWYMLRRHAVAPAGPYRPQEHEEPRGPRRRVRGRSAQDVPVGLSLRAALSLAARLGFEVGNKRRHGEVLVSHPVWAKPALVINQQRKDATRQLVRVLRRATEALAAKGAA